MKSRKIQDLNRYLIHVRFLSFYVVRIHDQVFAIDPKGLTLIRFVEAILNTTEDQKTGNLRLDSA